MLATYLPPGFFLRLARHAPHVLVLCLLAVATPASAQDSDVTPPVLVDFTFAPMTIDVSAGSQTVMVTLHVTDDLAGVGSGSVSFRSPSGAQVRTGVSSALTAGTRLDGTFVVPVVFPQFAEAGAWTASTVGLTDLAGNSTTISAAVLESRGFTTTLQVISTPDIESPHLVGISISPSVMDVSANDVQVTVDLHVTDNLSGVAFAACVPGMLFPLDSFILRSPSGVQLRHIFSNSIVNVGGTRADGTWRGTLTMPRFSEPGTWRVASLAVRDCAGNARFYTTATLLAMGFPIDVEVQSLPADTQPPALTSLSYVPIAINTSTGPQAVTVRFGIQDDLAGPNFSPTTPTASFFERGVQFRSPSGNQVRSAAFFSPFTQVSGTSLDGVWEATVFFPQFSEAGTWRIDMLQIKDAVRNMRTYGTAELEQMGFPVRLEVIRPSLGVDGTVGPGGGTITDETFGDRASVTFPPGAVTVPTSVAIDVFLEPLDLPNPTGFIGPGTRFVNIQLTPEPAFPLPPPGLTVVLPMPNPMPAGTILWLYKIDEATGSLVPAIDVHGHHATGIVAADGLSATFAGIASLSTVVGMIPDMVSVAIDIKPGEFPNAINLRSRGVTPVAILSSALFDARSVRPETVRLAGAAPRVVNGRPMFSFQDVNGDGLLDLVLQIETQDLSLTSSDTEAVLRGETTGGTPIIGRDAIRLVP